MNNTLHHCIHNICYETSNFVYFKLCTLLIIVMMNTFDHCRGTIELERKLYAWYTPSPTMRRGNIIFTIYLLLNLIYRYFCLYITTVIYYMYTY